MEDEKKTILTLEHCGDKVTVELSWDVSINDLIAAFYGTCVTATWQPVAILEHMKDFAEEKLEALGAPQE